MKTSYSLGQIVEVGIDEAGRGCFWGPIVAGAVIWPPEDEWIDEHREVVPLINDSKKVAKSARPSIAAAIQSLAVDWGVGFVNTDEINKNGMTWANQEAFRRAMGNCFSGLDPELLLIDGILAIPDCEVKQECIIGGDSSYVPIAAASILAKHGRDSWVSEWCLESAEQKEVGDRYDLLSNMGYGTVKHREGLKTYGAHELHRAQYIRNWC